MSGLSSRDRQILLATVSGADRPRDAREARNRAVARHRARARLRKLLLGNEPTGSAEEGVS